MTAPTTPAAPRGPQRFQTSAPTEESVSRAGSFAAAAALLLLVVGVPAALIALGGVPHVPTTWPTQDQLTAPITTAGVVGVLVWVVWLAWAQFVVCVLVELRSALSGVGLPRRVPLAGPSQRAARVLVASVLALLAVAGPATAATTPTSQPVASSSVAVSVEAGVTADDMSGVGIGSSGASLAAPSVEQAAVEQAAPGETTYWLGDVQLDQTEGSALVGQLVYVVQPPEGRYHDNLWDIAERTLGDGRRYQEIFSLNAGRPQPDGRELTLARLIQPGWLMAVPEGAVGAQRVTAVTAPAPDVQPAESSTVAGVATDSAADGGSAATVDLDEGVSARQDLPGSLAERYPGLLGAGLLAAGLLVVVQRRRRSRTAEPPPASAELEVALRIAAHPERASRLETALRSLAAEHARTGRPLPGVYAARVDDSVVELLIAPPAPEASAGWVPVDGGRRWLAQGADRHAAAGAPVAFPGLVSLGHDDAGADVLIDLEAAQGPVAVVGPGEHEVAAAIAAELATNQWSQPVEVHAADLPDELEELGSRYHRCSDVARLLAAWRMDESADAVLSGRALTGRAPGWTGRYLVLGAPEKAGPWPSGVGVVVCGEVPGARWRLELDGSGGGELVALGLKVRVNRLTSQDVRSLAGLLASPGPAPSPVPDDDRPAVPVPRRPTSPDEFDEPGPQVRVLGTVQVDGAEPLSQRRVELAAEVVVHVALHPDGVHPAVLGADLWPHGVTPQVRDAALDRAVQWLGTDGSGRARLRPDEDGRLRLDPGVPLDLDVLWTLLGRSRAASSSQDEREVLTQALDLGSRPLLAGRASGRYAWLARARVERDVRTLVVDAAHRLAVLAGRDGDPEAAAAAARSGLQLAPLEEVLWLDLLEAEHLAGGGVVSVLQQLRREVDAAGGGPLPARVLALADELDPGSVTAPAIA